MLSISLELLSAVRIAGVQLAFHAVALGNRDAGRNGMAAPVGGGLVLGPCAGAVHGSAVSLNCPHPRSRSDKPASSLPCAVAMEHDGSGPGSA